MRQPAAYAFGCKLKNVVALLLLVLFVAGTAPAEGRLSDALLTHSKRLRGMIIEIVASMPEDKYDFRPTKDVRTFHEICEHMVGDIYSHSGWVMGISAPDSSRAMHEKVHSLKTREEIIAGLNAAYDYSDQQIAKITDQNAWEMVTGMRAMHQTRFEAIMQCFEDQMDHYGNLVVYVRMNGVVPPDTANRAKQLKENTQGNSGMGNMPGMDHSQH